MEIVLRLLAIGFGIAALAVFSLSLARTAIINRPTQDPLLNFAKSLTHALIQRLRRRRGTSAAPQRLLAWYMPLFILSLIATWFLLALCAFGALYWAVGAETTLRGTLIASGSALTTLGFATPSTLPGQVLGIMEGAIGLMIMVFMLSFIPAYQAAVQACELQVAWLHRRLGLQPTGIGVLLWLKQNTADGDSTGFRAGFWVTWESWFRQIQATHVLAPEVIYTPSVFAGHSWVSCASALLDAAALHLAAVDGRDAPTAEATAMCAQEGIDAIRKISATIGCRLGEAPPTPERVTRGQFAAALGELAVAGINVCRDEACAWERFVAIRSQYEQPLHYLSARTLTDDYLEFLPAGVTYSALGSAAGATASITTNVG